MTERKASTIPVDNSAEGVISNDTLGADLRFRRHVPPLRPEQCPQLHGATSHESAC